MLGTCSSRQADYMRHEWILHTYIRTCSFNVYVLLFLLGLLVCVPPCAAPRWPVPPEDIIERAPAQEPVTATAALFVTRGGAGELDALGAEGQSQDVVYLERRGEERHHFIHMTDHILMCTHVL